MYTYSRHGNNTKSSSSASTSTAGSNRSRERRRLPSASSSAHTSESGVQGTKRQRPIENDYSNNYLHTRALSTQYIRNIVRPTEGYPKLQKLKELKAHQVASHCTKPYGVHVDTNQIVPTLNRWVNQYALQFDVIMIGALVENQFLLPLLNSLPLYKLCAKPGFLFIWTTTANIKQLTALLNGDKWNKKFRRSEELVFVPVDENSPYFPTGQNDGFYNDPVNGNCQSLLSRKQWHCWMCITGTVRRSTDTDLIHCNIDTDLQMDQKSPGDKGYNNAVPEAIYRVAENFSNSNRRLHIIPCKTGYRLPVKIRKGWVIMSPDVLVDNFDPVSYEMQLHSNSLVKYKSINNNGCSKQVPQYLVPQTSEIEALRPKSPV
ncbi:hypothetical protein JCM33374_g4228 [Metschnikowia sp. JCM 33374]|nr:hypothetical protein JCM33374_g4228 [Metschnikowia sp. JCM 33374]